MLELEGVSFADGSAGAGADQGKWRIEPCSLQFPAGQLSVLAGPTGAGKTTLLRIMAGLETPGAGRVILNGQDITRIPVRRRNVAMVYQAFVNYPAWSVRDNLASPMKVKRKSPDEIRREVDRLAALLKLEPYLGRKPSELSGGQQQRVAIARALAKDADVVLLDEPLANLDYKLREDLLTEFPRLFSGSRTVVVYATSEPIEALKLGALTATMQKGRVTQVGQASALYRHPKNLATAQLMSDAPLNLLGRAGDGSVLAARAHHLKPGPARVNARSFNVTIAGADVTGSETFVHLKSDAGAWIMLLHGVHAFSAGEALSVHVAEDDILRFNAAGEALEAATAGRA